MFVSLAIQATADSPTREIFGNIPAAAKVLFYLLALAAVVVFAVGVYRRARLWRLGRPDNERVDWGLRLRRFARDVLLQRRVPGRGTASTAHILLFAGFVVLLIGTTLVAVEHGAATLTRKQGTEAVFHRGVYYAAFEIVTDVFGLALLAGCALLAYRRARRPASLSHNRLDWVVLGSLALLVLTGYLVEGLRILLERPATPGYSFAGLATARLLESAGLRQVSVAGLHFGVWWLHAALALGLIAAIPYTRLLHLLAGSVNLIASPRPALGTMQLVSIEELETSGKVGVGEIRDFQRWQLLGLDACVSCGRCEEACPAFEAGKPLSPKTVVQDVQAALGTTGPELHGQTIAAETLWSCTTCAACTEVCPLGVHPLDMITEMRRFLVGEGQLRGPAATALQKMQRSGNPWGLPAEDRLRWADGLNVPTAKENPDFEVLYWVGCAAAYDRRLQKVARSVASLLHKAGVSFAVLGTEERCTGESARRMGDEFLFQELAERNIAVLDRYQVKRIVTHCPHCLNTLQRDYPQLGGHYQLVHHTEYLAELLASGRLRLEGGSTAAGAVTFHDPCYLARAAGVTEAPRALLRPVASVAEMPRNRRRTSCCGGGGGRLWFDDPPAQRIGVSRVQEATATAADTISVACPYCLLMLSDTAASSNAGVEVQDVAELLDVAAVGGDVGR